MCSICLNHQTNFEHTKFNMFLKDDMTYVRLCMYESCSELLCINYSYELLCYTVARVLNKDELN